jgi:hypothetical protein
VSPISAISISVCPTPTVSIDDDIEAGQHQPTHRPDLARHATQLVAVGQRANEQAFVVGRVLDTNAIAQQSATAQFGATGWINSQHSDRPPASRHSRIIADTSDDFPAPGGPVTPIRWPSFSARSPDSAASKRAER